MLSAQNILPQKDFASPKQVFPESNVKEYGMSAGKDLFNLQKVQHYHDEKFHQDIWCLPFNSRIKHMVLHLCKYNGKFILAEECKDHSLFIGTLVDTCIIALATANILNMKLSYYLNLEKEDKPDILSVGNSILSSDFSFTKDPYRLVVSQLGKITGRMAKACESMDHGESFDSRGTLEKTVQEVVKLSLATAAMLKLDLNPLLHCRWKEIEEKSIF